MKVLVAGSTGYLGQRVVQELYERGPEILTHEEILRSAFAALGRPTTVTHLPRWSLQAGRTVFSRATPLRMHQIVEFPLAVLADDLIAPTVGTRRISDHFAEEARR